MFQIKDLINKDIELNKQCSKIIEEEKSTEEPREAELECLKGDIVNFIEELIKNSKFVSYDSDYKWITQTVRNWKIFLKVHFSDYSRWVVPPRDDLIKEDWSDPNSDRSTLAKQIAAELLPNITKEAISGLVPKLSEKIAEKIIPKIVEQVKMELKSKVGEKRPGAAVLSTEILEVGGGVLGATVSPQAIHAPLNSIVGKVHEAKIFVRGTKTNVVLKGVLVGNDIRDLRFKGITYEGIRGQTSSPVAVGPVAGSLRFRRRSVFRSYRSGSRSKNIKD